MACLTTSSRGRQRALCILGMHRSGTSAVTRAFNLLGAFVGDEGDLLRAMPDNPEGFWERTDIFNFHERLLAALGRRWDTALILPDGWERSPVVAPFREELKRLVVTAFAGHPLWAWKDPRTCLLLDLWKDILAELGVDFAAVVVLRHPRDVAASLSWRNGFGLEKSCGAWLSHTLAALRSLEGERSVFIGYDAFLEDPVGQIGRCAETLGLGRPDGFDVAVRRSVRKDLRHNMTTAADHEVVPSPVRDLYELIRPATESPAGFDGAWFARIRDLHREYATYTRFFSEDLEQCVGAAARLSGMEERCRESDERAAAAGQQAAEAERRALSAGQQAAEAEQRALGAGQQAAEAERRALSAGQQATEAEQRALNAEEQARALDRQRQQAVRALEEILASRIWRITAPARKTADFFRGKVRSGKPRET